MSLSLFQTKSLLKLKATPLIVLLALFILVISFTLSDVNIAKKYKLFEDILLVSQTFLLHMVAIFYSFELMQKEQLNGMFILPLSTGIKRKNYLQAIFLSLMIVLFILLLIFLLIDTVLLLMLNNFNFFVMWQLVLYYLSASLLAASVVMFAQYVSNMNAMIYSVLFFLIGQGLDELWLFLNHPNIVSEVSMYFANALYYFLPNYSLFDHISIVVNRMDIDMVNIMIVPVMYFIGLLCIYFLIAYKKYSTKVLKVGE